MAERNTRANEMMEKELQEFISNYCENADDIYANNRYRKIMDAIKYETEGTSNLVLTVTENGALVYSGTGSALVDFNARATELRYADADVIKDAMCRAYEEDPLKAIKLLFQTGNIRGGKGERNIFNKCMEWLAENHPVVAIEVLPLIPEYTRWDYLGLLTVSEYESISKCATDIIVKQFWSDKAAVEKAAEGENVHISLLAKWMPSLQTKKAEHKVIVRHLLKALHMQEREYRHTLSLLRGHLNIIEKAMSEKNYEAIDMEKMTSKQQLRYAAFLKRVMAEKRHEYLQAVLRGEKKMNTAVLNPLEIYHAYQSEGKSKGFWRLYIEVEFDEVYEVIWKLIQGRITANGDTLVIRDGSGSMLSPIGQGSTATMLDAASAMSIYCAEHLSGVFKNKFITFSSRPQLVDMSECETLCDKMNFLQEFDDCSNTDLEATFDLVLKAAVDNKLRQDEIPSYLMILSDMEFDVARGVYGRKDLSSRKTLFETIREKWNAAGYKMPTLVFWQLNGKRTLFPEIDEENGIIFLSGYSTSELELVMAGKYEESVEVSEEVEIMDELTGERKLVVRTVEQKRILSPMEQLNFKLSDERYDAVEAAVLRGLQKEKELPMNDNSK